MENPDMKKTRTAYHEAGHAVVAMLLGYPLHHVSIIPGFDREGEAVSTHFRCATDEHQAAILCAGLLAEQFAEELRLLQKVDAEKENGAFSDIERMLTLKLDSEDYLDTAQSILSEQWPLVVSVANALIQVGIMEPDHLSLLIEDHLNKHN